METVLKNKTFIKLSYYDRQNIAIVNTTLLK